MRTVYVLGDDIDSNMMSTEPFHYVWEDVVCLSESPSMYVIEHPEFEKFSYVQGIRIFVSKTCEQGKNIAKVVRYHNHMYEISVSELFFNCLAECIDGKQLKTLFLNAYSCGYVLGKETVQMNIRKAIGLEVNEGRGVVLDGQPT